MTSPNGETDMNDIDIVDLRETWRRLIASHDLDVPQLLAAFRALADRPPIPTDGT